MGLVAHTQMHETRCSIQLIRIMLMKVHCVVYLASKLVCMLLDMGNWMQTSGNHHLAKTSKDPQSPDVQNLVNTLKPGRFYVVDGLYNRA
jgi:hypothetical protein